MSDARRYCPRCDKKTGHHDLYHQALTDQPASFGERLLIATFTMGLSELAGYTITTCFQCGYRRKV